MPLIISFYNRNHFFTDWADNNNLERISNDKKINKCTFKDASKTLEVIEQIFRDYESNGKL